MAVAIIVPGGVKAATYQIVGLNGAGASFSLAWAGHAEDATSQSAYTFTSVAIGAADANRVVAVGFWMRSIADSDAITSMTIGGISATQVSGARSTRSDSGFAISDIWYASVPTGTTATVVVNLSQAVPRSGISTYRIITTTPTPNNATFGIGADDTATSGTLTIPSGGAGLAMFGCRTALTTMGWTNATKDYEADIAGLASVSSATVTATNAITANNPPTNAAPSAMSCAAWGP